MTFLSRIFPTERKLFPIAALFLLLTAQAFATAVPATGYRSDTDYPGNGPSQGSFNVTFDATGLPVAYDSRTTARGYTGLSNLQATAAPESTKDDSTFAPTDSGLIEQGALLDEELQISANPLAALLYRSPTYVRSGPDGPSDDPGVSSFLRLGSNNFRVNGSTSHSTTTAEPTPLSLALLGFSLVTIGSCKLNVTRTLYR